MYELVGQDGKVVVVKNVMDKQEYLASGWYKEHKKEVAEKAHEAEKPERKEMDSKSAVELAQALVSGEKEEKTLEDMSLEELKEKHKEVFGKSAVGAVKEETLIKKIKEELSGQ